MGQSNSVGDWSAAMGQSSANGLWSTAMGNSNTGGWYSTAVGKSSASGAHSTAMGESIASGDSSTAAGGSTASGFASIAMGQSIADGYLSTAMGQSYAKGYYSVALGVSNANGAASIAIGQSTATGDFSTAIGNTFARSYRSTALGINNDSVITSSTNSWVDTDPLVYIGNSRNNSTMHNAMMILKNGKVGIGTNTPTTLLHISDGVTGLSYSPLPGVVIERNNNTYLTFLTPDAYESGLLFGHSGDPADGGIIYNNSGSVQGLQLRTNGNVSRMVITNTGNVGIGTNTPFSTLHVKGIVDVFNADTRTGAVSNGTSSIDAVELKSAGTDAYIAVQRAAGAALHLTRASGAGILAGFYVGGTLVGSITTSGTTTAFNTTSDMRLKENIQSSHYGLTILLMLNVKDYNFKTDVNKQLQTGFMAQEVYKFYPQAVHVGGEDAKTDPWTIDYSRFTPVVVKAMQEQQQIIETQQNQINELKENNDKINTQLEEITKTLKLLTHK
ncbi:MAG: tail fiber domain-containing protein [Chitinophagaceae bacterium]|nr:tail fiber domain-containing protein [Chitinophagaceae bacterium]